MRTLLTIAFWTVMTPLGALIGIPWTLLTGNADFLYRIAMWIVRVGMRLTGIRIEIVGREKLDPAAAYIFMSNHVSNLDPPLLVPVLPRRTSVLVKKELFRIPILGTAMRIASLVPVDRSNRDAAIASVRTAGEVVRGGLNMTVFPEGTRSRDGRMLPFKKGPFYLALETGCPIVHVTLLGTDEILPKGNFFLRQGTATVIFHEPVRPADYPERDALMAAVRERIASALPEKRR